LAFKFKINTVFSLQLFQILRFTAFLLISVFFAKSHLTVEEMGDWELMLFISTGISYFWISGIIQSLIPLYNNNSSFKYTQRPGLVKSPEIFNAFFLLTIFSVVFTSFILIAGYLGFSSKSVERIPYHNLLALYFFFNAPGALIEYIYLLKNKPFHIFCFGIISFLLLLTMVCVPIYMGFGLIVSIWGLIIFTILRYLFLLLLIIRYAKIQFSWSFIKAHLNLGYPIILSALLSGSTQFIDGFLASITSNSQRFAVFRMGTVELPFVNQLANSLSNAMLMGFATVDKMKETLEALKVKSLKLMHYLFPLSIVVMLFSKWIFGVLLYNDNFFRSADVFMVYQLIIIARLVFPHTILIGLKKTKVLMYVSIINIILNIGLSLFFVQYYGIVGLALGTVSVLVLEKIFLVSYNYYKLGIKPIDYIPVKWYLFYSAMIVMVFVLIDHRVIKIY
jgi:O-antigen/teichoic acid export membrane protein